MNHLIVQPPNESNPTSTKRVRVWFRSARWRQTIRESGLPNDAQKMLLGLVAETGLLSDEKEEVATELVAHFQDGLQRGLGISRLIEEFGDPSMAATLIRNGKQRNRTMKNRLVQASMWLGALGGGGFIVLAIMFYLEKPNPSTDYLAILNQPIMEVPDDQKGWTIYRDLWIKYGFSEGGEGNFPEVHIKNGNEYGRLVRASDGEAWQNAIAKLASAEDLLEGFRVGGVRPSFGIVYHSNPANYSREDFKALFPNCANPTDNSDATENDLATSNSMMMVLLPHVQVMRKAARLLVVDTRWAIEQNDTDRAVRNLEALFGISGQVTESKFLIAGLVGLAVQAMALDSVDELLASKVELSPTQLEQIQAAIEKCNSYVYLSVETERAGIMDVIQCTYSDDGNGDGRLTAAGLNFWNKFLSVASVGQPEIDAPFGSWGRTLESAVQATIAPTTLLIMATRKQLTEQTNKLFDQYPQHLDKPYFDTSIQQLEQEVRELGSGYVLLQKLHPALQMARHANLRIAAQRHGAIAGLAAIQFQRDHGRWPESLNDLVGKYMEEIPLDPIDHRPLRYQILDNGFIVYCIGADQVDDGGRSATRPTNPAAEPTAATSGSASTLVGTLPTNEYRFDLKPTGDWILWPRHSNLRDQ
ncbi:MAG: hypothetical protein JNK57_21230 [Planctomycetaceae bacterium]|nr:hypothetical protein [Planctomycetaceae bacterium]